MEKRYKVFVSSTFWDLEEERREVIQALLELDCISSGMEIFPAVDEDQWSYIKDMIDDCDYYILILAGRYGSLHPTTGKSYTHMEYEYAIEQGKPIIAFVHEDPSQITFEKSEKDKEGQEKLEEFRRSLERLYRKWKNGKELGGLVSRSVIQLMKRKPAIGWVRADLVPDEISAQEIVHLKKQIEDLNDKLIDKHVGLHIDATSLAQGEELITINFNYEFFGYNFDGDTNLIDKNSSCQVTWDKLFSFVLPHMIEAIQDAEIRRLTGEFVREFFVNSTQKRENIEGLYIKDSDFQTVRIQLIGLGLIVSSDGKWKLSPHGRNVMMNLKTVKRATKI